MRIALNDLLPGTDYALQFRSRSGALASEWSKVFTFTTDEDTLAPATPTGFAWVVSGTSFLATWNAVTTNSDATPLNDFSHYELTLTNDVDTVVFKTNALRFDLTFESNRAAFGDPDAQVKATLRAADKTGNLSAPTTQLTATNPAPAAPASATAVGIIDAVILSWEEVDEPDLKQYNVHLSTTDSGFTPGPSNLVWSGGATSYTHPTALYGTDHWFKVAAVDVFDTPSTYAAADATPLSSAGVDSDPPDVPTGLSVTGALNASDAALADFTITWTDPVDTDLADISVRYRRSSGETEYQYVTVPAGVQATVIRGLQTGVEYAFSVAAVDFSANYSAYTTAELETVSNAAPSQPSEATIVGDDLSFAVTHDLTKEAGGPLESDVVALQIFVGTTDTWATASPVLVEIIPVSPGSAVAVSSRIPLNIPDGDPNRWIYVKAVDSKGLVSTNSNSAAVSISALTGTYIEDLAVTSAKIQSLVADKITAGAGVIANLDVKSTLTIGTDVASGEIRSFEYADTAGASGFSLQDDALIIKTGAIEAAALKIQNSQNIMPLHFADFEHAPAFYDNTEFIIPADTTLEVQTSNVKFSTQSLEVVSTSATSRTLGLAQTGQYNVLVDGSESYIVSAYIYQASGSSKDFALSVTWSDASVSTGSTESVPSGTYTRISMVATAPGAATAARVGIVFAASMTYYVDGIQFEKKESQLTTPSQWRPPSATRIDGGIIRTGEIRSNNDVTVGGELQPSWSINLQGNAQFGDALIRGILTVGGPDDPVATDAAVRSFSTADDFDGVTNLLSNPGFETNTTGWEAVGGTFVRSTASSYEGTASAIFTPDGTTAEPYFQTTLAASPAVTAGNTYQFDLYHRSVGSSWVNTQKKYIRWYDNADAFISADEDTDTSVTVGTTYDLVRVSGLAPVGAVKAQIRYSLTGTPAASKTQYVDAVKLYLYPTTYPITKPSGVVEGDILIAFQQTADAEIDTAPTGGTQWLKLIEGWAQANVSATVWWKVAGDSEPSTYQMAINDPLVETSAFMGEGITSIIAIQDASQSLPVSAYLSGPDNSTGSSDTWIVTTPQTHPVRENLELRFAASIVSENTTWTPPSGFTERTDITTPDPYSTHTVVSRHLPGGGVTDQKIHQASAFLNRRLGITVNLLDIADEDLGGSRIRSANYVSGTTGWSVNSDGSAEFNDVEIRGIVDIEGSILVGDIFGPHITISDQFFGDESVEIGLFTGHADETTGTTLAASVGTDGTDRPQLLLGTSSFGNQNIVLMLMTGEDATGGDADYPQVGFGDFFGDTPTNQGLFYISDIFRTEVQGDFKALLDAEIVGDLIVGATLDVTGDATIDGEITSTAMSPQQVTSGDTYAFNNTAGSGTATTSGTCNSLGIAFTAPPSGKAFVSISGEIRSQQTQRYAGLGWRLGEGSSIGAGTEVTAADWRRAILTGENIDTSEPAIIGATHRYLITGLTPGDPYNVQAQHFVEASGGGTCDYRILAIEPTW